MPNSGLIQFAAPHAAPIFNYKDVSLILVPESGEGAIEIGRYGLHLKIADQFESIKDRPEYCIQLAKQDIWDYTTGWNNLHQKVNIIE